MFDKRRIICLAISAVWLLLVDGSAVAERAGEQSEPDETGPTIVLDYSEGAEMNPTEDFMYFVPLISPTLVSRESSPGSQQQGKMISCTRKSDSDSFEAVCKFRMVGKGTLTNKFDADEMIERNIKDAEDGEKIKHILDYIVFDGEGQGRMEVKGEISDSKATVTRVDVHFANSDDDVSPVKIGLYSLKPVDGKYEYENRIDKTVARVQTLTFKRSEGVPKMGIKLVSIKKAGAKEGWWARFKGTIANLFIPPLEVDKLGNDTMLDFGYAVYRGDPTFTFPKAKKLKEDVERAETADNR